MAKPYQERIRADGVSSLTTVYGSKIPPGKVVCITELTAYVYTDYLGDYTTSKYILLGVEVGGQKYYHMGRDIAATQLVIRSQNCIWIKEGDRPFAEFEATADTTTYEIVINGISYDESELKKGVQVAPVPKLV